MDAPRDDLIRFVSRDAATDGRTLTGYPVVFDTWTTINSYEGHFRERIAPGALNRTLANNGEKVKVLFNHGMDPQIGNKPLGRATVMRTDSRGLYVEVPLSDTSYNDDLLALMRDGAIDGMSFRFAVVDDQWATPKRGLPERTITELKLFEFGPVTFPAYEATTVGLRSHTEFSWWRSLTEDKRDAIAGIAGVVPDLRTLADQPALIEPHLDDEARDDNPTEPEPGADHLKDGIPISTDRRHLARRALRQARARSLGVIQ